MGALHVSQGMACLSKATRWNRGACINRLRALVDIARRIACVTRHSKGVI